MAKAGRSNKYDSHIKPNFELILGCLRSGYTEGSICKRIGVSTETWCQAKNKYLEFSELIKKGGEDSTALVVNKLYQRATGYEYEEVQTELRDIGGKQLKLVRKTKKQMAPDVGAIAIVLFNRDPAKWQNKQEIRHSGRIENSGVLLVSGDMEKGKWLQKLMKQNQSSKPG